MKKARCYWSFSPIAAPAIRAVTPVIINLKMSERRGPSAIRSTGGGWASFVAKFAAVAAPLVGAAWFLSARPAVLNGFAFTGYCLAGVAIGVVALAVYAKRLHAERALETAAVRDMGAGGALVPQTE